VWDKQQGRVHFSTKELEQEPGDMLRNPQLVYQVADEMAAAFRASTRGKAAIAAAAAAADQGEKDRLWALYDSYMGYHTSCQFTQ